MPSPDQVNEGGGIVASIDIRVVIRGYEAAFGRATHARGSSDATEMFIPLFESLNWASSLVESDAREGRRLFSSDEVKTAASGLKFVRNAVHHQWADAIYGVDGWAIPWRIPWTFHEWHWRPLTDLPKNSRRREGNEEYKATLAARNVMEVLEMMLRAARSGASDSPE